MYLDPPTEEVVKSGKVAFIKTAPYNYYLSIEMVEQAACPGVIFATGIPIDYSEVEPGVESNLGVRAEKVRSQIGMRGRL